MKSLGNQTKKNPEEKHVRVSSTEDKLKEIDQSVKENIKSKNIQKQNIQEIWDTRKDQTYKEQPKKEKKPKSKALI